jgi:hypothetical protein
VRRVSLYFYFCFSRLSRNPLDSAPTRIPGNALDGGPSQPAARAPGGPLACSLWTVSWEVHVSEPRQPGDEFGYL